MLSNEDKEYLKGIPALELSEDQKFVTGTISFDAVFDPAKEADRFTLIGSEDANTYSGTRLTGAFKVSIEPNWSPSGLPKLVVLENLPKEARRHFYTGEPDLVACVCAPVKEIKFMKNFSLKEYIETLVIPFLYGQVFFDLKGEWPWKDYSHNTPGILESYHRDDGTDVLDEFLARLKLQRTDWSRLEPILFGSNLPKGHTPCFCSKHDFIRRCHPEAWEGLKKVYSDIHNKSE